MPTPRKVKQQAEEADKLVEQLKEPAEEETKEEVMEEASEQPTEAVEPQAQEPEDEWKKRFVGMQKTHEAAVREHKAELLKVKEREALQSKEINDLRQKINDLSRPTDASLVEAIKAELSEQDREFLGDEAVSAITKAAKVFTQNQVDDLRAQMNELRESQQKQATTAEQQRQASEQQQYAANFKTRLSGLVDDLDAVDKDPRFKSWMVEHDEISGLSRQELFRRAYYNGDVERVAEFYSKWKRLNGSRSPETKVVPRQSSTTTPVQKETRIWSQDEIKEFYRKVATGQMKDAKKAAAIEAEINAAITERRVR